jgi:hypothetical protein
MAGYWIAERWDELEGDFIACWTTERPGITGPTDLERLLPELILSGWNVRHSEVIVFGRTTAPQSWSVMADPGRDETATQDGYIFTELAGNDEATVRPARARAGVLLDELTDQLNDDPDLGGAVPEVFGPPLLTTATWTAWNADVDGTGVWRVRVEFQITWSAAV